MHTNALNLVNKKEDIVIMLFVVSFGIVSFIWNSIEAIKIFKMSYNDKDKIFEDKNITHFFQNISKSKVVVL